MRDPRRWGHYRPRLRIATGYMSIFSDYLYAAHRLDRASAARFCPRFRGTVVDVGCGRRPYLNLLGSGVKYIGMEHDARLKPDVIGSVLDIPFDDGSIHGIMCNEVLEHTPFPSEAAAELHRVLAPGGYAYVTVPQSWGLHYEPHDYFRFTCYGIRHILEHSGLQVIEVQRLGGLFTFIGVRLSAFAVEDCFSGFAIGWGSIAEGIGLPPC